MRRHRFVSAHGPADMPVAELNTTPLIDVMLVLLIMFIVTIPISTHKVPLDLPAGPPRSAEPVVHRLVLDSGGRIVLDGAVLRLAEVRGRLAPIAADPTAILSLRVDGAAPYGTFDALLAEVKRAGVTRIGMVGNEEHARSL